MADVFISYSRADRALVIPLADSLKELGLDIWFDLVVHNGTSFSDEINEELRTAKAILVCWSENAAGSHWVKAEAHVGLEHQKIAACFISPCKLWPPFNIIQTDDLADWKGDWGHLGFQKLMEQIGKLVGRPGLRNLCAAQADATGSRLADWASTYKEDPAAASVWPIWERRQREDFHKSVADVRQTLTERSKLRLSKAEAKLSSAERDFEAWLARGRDAVKHRRPDPTAILRSSGDEQPTGGTPARDLSPPLERSRPAPVLLAASVVLGLVVGGVGEWLAIKPSPPNAVTEGRSAAKSGEVESALRAELNQVSSEKVALEGQLKKVTAAASSAQDARETAEHELSLTKKQVADLSDALNDSSAKRADVSAVRKMFEDQIETAKAGLSSAQTSRQAAERDLTEAKQQVDNLTLQLANSKSDYDRSRQQAATASSRADSLSTQLGQAQARIASLEAQPRLGSGSPQMTNLEDNLQTRAHAAVATYYRQHNYEEGDSLDGLQALYPEQVNNRGRYLKRDKQIRDLRQYYSNYTSFHFKLIDTSFDYSGCTDEASCLVRGLVEVASKKLGQDDFRFARTKFSLRFDLNAPLMVRYECAVAQNASAQQAACE